MSSHQKPKLSRREFAGALALGVAPLLAGQAAPAFLGEALAQEEKKPAVPQAQAEPEEEGNLTALRAFEVPVETEPAFVFQAKVGGRHGG